MTNMDVENTTDESWQWSRLRPWMMMLANQGLPDFLRHRVDASDIVQHAMTEAWTSRESFEGTTTAERMAWLRVILKRTILRQQERLLGTQKRDMRRDFSLDQSVDDASMRLERFAVETATGPDAAVEKAEQIVHVMAMLEQLPPDHRQILVLRHLEELDHDAIAKRMNRSVSATRMLWIRALKSLRKQIHSEG